MSKFLLSALLMILLSACSNRPVSMQTVRLQANLTANCPPIPKQPVPLIDPPRAEWEAELMLAYGDCAARHRLTVEAWPVANVDKSGYKKQAPN
jgi:hypothetical protein